MIFLILLAFVAFLLGIYWIKYVYFGRRYSRDHWTSMGVKEATYPEAGMLGNSPATTAKVLFGKESVVNIAKKQYEEMAGEKFYGAYGPRGVPVLIIKDPELANQIMVKHFHSFVDRTTKGFIDRLVNKENLVDRVWSKTLVMLRGEEWKDTRSTFSPIFTSGRLKGMSHLINDIAANHLSKAFEEAAVSGEEIDLKEVFGKYSMDSIASCAFGIDARSLTSSAESQFVRHGKRVFQRDITDFCKVLLSMVPGGFSLGYKLFGMSVFKSEPTAFFYEVIRAAIEERAKTKERRNDLVDLMIDAMKNELDPNDDDADGDEDDSNLKSKSKKKELDVETLASTALIMLVAGYETTSQAMGFAAYHLVMNPELQDRLQDELDPSFQRNDGELPAYADILALEYLDMVVSETLRRYPAAILQRAANEACELPGHPQVKISKDMDVHFNVVGMHMDPELYPDPTVFDPERFSKENKAKRHPYAFLSFGHGPRNCIGMRFALYEAKAGLAAVFGKYRLVKTEHTPEKLTHDPTSQFGAAKEALLVKVEKRD